MRKSKKKSIRLGFTLVEVLVVISIILLLVGVLVPALGSAKEQANCMICLSNQRSCIQGLLLMACSNTNRYPAAYIETGRGYETWAGNLVANEYVYQDGLTCPTIPQGGLPPANPAWGNFREGQVSETAGAVDIAPPSCAFTVNEAILPRPRFEETATWPRPAQLVSTEEIESDIIILTEFNADWQVLSPGNNTCRSYLPVHGLVGIGPMGADRYDLNAVKIDHEDKPCFKDGAYRRFNEQNLIVEPPANISSPPRLNLIGRNHAKRDEDGFRSSTFTYADGHAECVPVSQTLDSYVWGTRVYSVTGDQRIAD